MSPATRAPLGGHFDTPGKGSHTVANINVSYADLEAAASDLKAGQLFGDSGMTSMLSSLRSTMNKTLSGLGLTGLADIGITLPGPDGALAVHFPETGGGWRRIAPARLPPHETAYAMTVHKSQGSEFDGVLVLLPEHRSRVLTRELLYTGITRARQHVAISAPADVLAATIAAATHRHSGLVARLRALQAAA